MNFLNKIDKLEAAAKHKISRLVRKQNGITLFRDHGEEEWEVDIYSDVPDFLWFDLDHNAEWVAAMELKENDGVIEITGIFKGDSYPDKLTVTVSQLDPMGAIYIAHHLMEEYA